MTSRSTSLRVYRQTKLTPAKNALEAQEIKKTRNNQED